MAKAPKSTGKMALFKSAMSKKISSLTDTDFELITDRISTGSLRFDFSIGGGFPVGKVIEIYGANSCGKSTIASLLTKSAQNKFPDKGVLVVDAEQVWNHLYSKKYGVNYDPERFMFAQPDTAEECLQLVSDAAESGLFSLVILDSVGAMQTKAQLEKDLGDQTMGELARAMSNGLRKIAPIAHKTGTTVLFLNQIRMKIGGYSPTGAPPKTTPGGEALKFFASVRLELNVVEVLTNGKVPIGQKIKVHIRKNKFGPNVGSFEITVYYNEGFRNKEELVEVMIENGVVRSSGAWCYFGDYKWNGRKALTEAMLGNDDLYNELLNAHNSFMNEEATFFNKAEKEEVPEFDPETGEILSPASEEKTEEVISND